MGKTTHPITDELPDAELAHHLGHDKHQPISNPAGNTLNDFSRKKLKGEFGERFTFTFGR